MVTENITIRTEPRNIDEIRERCGYSAHALTLGDVVARDVERYHALLRDARRPLRDQFSRAELMLIVDSCNGTLFEPSTVCALPFNIEDSISLDRLDEKWGVDGSALLAKLQALSPVQTQSLVDAVERFWTNHERYSGDGSDVSDILA